MRSNFLKRNIESQASYVTFGYGQVEPNKLSAQKTGQIFAQLPAAADIEVLEQGQFVKYDYAKNVCDFEGKGPWMLVFNEIKLYREDQWDCEFAMIKDNYQARLYSPFGGPVTGEDDEMPFDQYLYDSEGNLVKPAKQTRYYNGIDSEGNESVTLTFVDGSEKTYAFDDVTAGPDIYEINYNEDPFHIEGQYKPQRMPEGTQMVPRVFLTNLGDIFTTNTINADPGSLSVGDTLKVGEKGILEPGEDDAMTWQVVKVYTMPDHQPGVKVMRIA